VFVPAFGGSFQGNGANATLVAELSYACVDGFVLALKWAEMQPTIDGGYDFSSLDANLGTLADAGKKAAVELEAGEASPAWVCQSPGGGATCMSIVEAAAPANAPNTSCGPELIPVPWDPTFEALFHTALDAFVAHVAGNTTVVEIKVTGVNDTTDETAMPDAKGGTIGCNSGSACSSGMCTQSNAVIIIDDAGYGTQTMESAFLTYAGELRDAGPNITLGSQVSASLPNPGSGDLAEEIVDQFIDAGLAPITVQDNGLRAVSGVDPGTRDAFAAGVAVGFQEYLGVYGDTACKMSQGLMVGQLGWDGGCGNEQVMQIVVGYGIDAGASFLELYQDDVQAFPSVCMTAHNLLVP
jgi:hypothetical protein